MKRFDRHENMSLDTVRAIRSLAEPIKITDSSNEFLVANYLYGLFDGYNYSEEIRAILPELDAVSVAWTEDVKMILDEVDGYPSWEQ